MKRTLTVILCMLFCTPSLLLAQHMTVTGKVTDQDGLPLVGVTVVVKGTTNGVSSGSDGAYRISGLSSKDVLQFSSIGMVSAEFTVGNRTVIDVTLKEDMLALEDVVVVGYGSMKNKDLTAPISTVKGSEIVKHSTPNPLQALQGKVAGVQISNFGEPGSSPNIRIRGVGSFTNENPLYVVDGMFYDNIDFLNNSDVQDIAILKDASAASIYGVRASNGVIIITTKQGKFNQKAKISYDGYVGVQTVTNMLGIRHYDERAGRYGYSSKIHRLLGWKRPRSGNRYGLVRPDYAECHHSQPQPRYYGRNREGRLCGRRQLSLSRGHYEGEKRFRAYQRSYESRLSALEMAQNGRKRDHEPFGTQFCQQ